MSKDLTNEKLKGRLTTTEMPTKNEDIKIFNNLEHKKSIIGKWEESIHDRVLSTMQMFKERRRWNWKCVLKIQKPWMLLYSREQNDFLLESFPCT